MQRHYSGFTPDDRRVVFCSDFNERTFWTNQIFTCNADTGGDIIQLTNNKHYNEHACYSPDGNSMVWMTNAAGGRGCDWWMMNADGTNQHQLTFFNQPGHPESSSKPITCCLSFFSPNGDAFLGGAQNSIIKQTGDSYMVKLR